MKTAEEYMSRVIEAMENPKPAISLRDWFAGQALAGISSLGGDGFSLPPQDEAAWAYARADAMLAARETSHDL